MKTNRQKLTKRLDELASKKTRQRDNKCILCGEYVGQLEKLQAHHWIKSRGQSNKYRWDLHNLCSLCYACHVHKIHQHGTVPLLDELKTRIFLNGIITKEKYEEICKDTEIAKYSIKDLEDKLEELKNDSN